MVSKRVVASFAVGFVVYMLVMLMLSSHFQPALAVGGKFGMMGGFQPTSQNNDYAFYLVTTSLVSLLSGTIAGGLTYHLYPEDRETKAGEEEPEYVIDDVVWGILNENEKKVMKEVVRSEGVTQDSLVHRLGYSKAKLSILLNDLEKKDLLMREKLGRTNSILLTERMKKVLSKNGE